MNDDASHWFSRCKRSGRKFPNDLDGIGWMDGIAGKISPIGKSVACVVVFKIIWIGLGICLSLENCWHVLDMISKVSVIGKLLAGYEPECH